MRSLFPRTDADRVHRRLAAAAFPSVPRPVAFALQAALWLRWVLFDAWRASFSVWRNRSQRNRSQRNRSQQGGSAAAPAGLARTLWRAVAYGIHPRSVTQLKLGNDASLNDVLAYIHPSETRPFHWSQANRSGDPSGAAALLADKATLCKRLGNAGLPVVETLASWRPHETVDLNDLPAAPHGLIIKPNSANSSRGILRIAPGELGQARDVRNRVLDGSVESHVRDLQRQGDVVIAQRYVPTHPALAALGTSSEEAVVVRAITTMETGAATVTAAYAELPFGDDGYVVRSVDDDGWLAEPEAVQVPGWDQLVATACAAHELDPLPTAPAIAWDIVVGPGGPQILEGNFSWSLIHLQRDRGPLLADPARISKLL